MLGQQYSRRIWRRCLKLQLASLMVGTSLILLRLARVQVHRVSSRALRLERVTVRSLAWVVTDVSCLTGIVLLE